MICKYITNLYFLKALSDKEFTWSNAKYQDNDNENEEVQNCQDKDAERDGPKIVGTSISI